ncbi:MAG: hypothetical protein IK092_00150 [Muribaculaceae bacterium]|nr:hypothetical protein [Muribaculaceae bacterium]
MKKLLLLFTLVAAFVLQANASVTIKIQADIPEGQNLYIHSWVTIDNQDVPITQWPGEYFTYSSTSNGITYYEYYIYSFENPNTHEYIYPTSINFLLHRGTPNGETDVIGKTADFIGANNGDVFVYQNDGTLTRKTPVELFDVNRFISDIQANQESLIDVADNCAFFVLPYDLWNVENGVAVWPYINENQNLSVSGQWPGDALYDDSWNYDYGYSNIYGSTYRVYRWVQDQSKEGTPAKIIFNNNLAEGATQTQDYDFVNRGIYLADYGMLGTIPAVENIPINESTFPDSAFRKYITDVVDLNHNGTLSPNERNNVTSMSFRANIFGSNVSYKVHNIIGASYFPNLKSLLFKTVGHDLLSLDLTGLTNLETLECGNTRLATLDLSPCPNLKVLDCSEGRLTSLDVSPCTKLVTLKCGNLRLGTLDVSYCPDLQTLECSSCDLTSLNITGCTKLTTIDCSKGSLTSLNVSHCPDLGSLNCSNNRITTLNMNGCTQIYNLNVSGNKLASLDVSAMTHLSTLNCSDGMDDIGIIDQSMIDAGLYSQDALDKFNTILVSEVVGNCIETLDLTNCTNLSTLKCSGNKLTTLSINSPTISEVDASNNLLTSFTLPAGISYLYKLNLKNNRLTSFTIPNDAATTLNEFNISANPIADITAVGLNNLTKVTKLNLSGINLSNVNALDQLLPAGVVELDFTGCGLTAIDLGNLNDTIKSLSCGLNNLGTLDLSGMSKLKSLVAPNCSLTTITLPTSYDIFSTFYAPNNQLETLDLSAYNKLAMVGVNNNQLTSLTLPAEAHASDGMAAINCSNNQLTSLDVSGYQQLMVMEAQNNQLKSFTTRQGSIVNFNLSNNCLTHIDLSNIAILNMGSLMQVVLMSEETEPDPDDPMTNMWNNLNLENPNSTIELFCKYYRMMVRGKLYGDLSSLLGFTIVMALTALPAIQSGIDVQEISIANNSGSLTADARQDQLTGNIIYYIRLSDDREAGDAPKRMGPRREHGFINTDDMLGSDFDPSKVDLETLEGAEVVEDTDWGTYLKLTPESGSDGKAYGTVSYNYNTGYDPINMIAAMGSDISDATPEQLELIRQQLSNGMESVPFSFEWEADSPTAIEIVKAGNAKEISRIYYNSLGQASRTPHNGLNVIVKTYDNGTKQVEKQMFK